jgi:hypothetical protein
MKLKLIGIFAALAIVAALTTAVALASSGDDTQLTRPGSGMTYLSSDGSGVDDSPDGAQKPAGTGRDDSSRDAVSDDSPGDDSSRDASSAGATGDDSKDDSQDDSRDDSQDDSSDDSYEDSGDDSYDDSNDDSGDDANDD